MYLIARLQQQCQRNQFPPLSEWTIAFMFLESIIMAISFLPKIFVSSFLDGIKHFGEIYKQVSPGDFLVEFLWWFD